VDGYRPPPVRRLDNPECSVTGDVQQVVVGEELVDSGLVNPAHGFGLLLPVADALGQRESGGDNVQEANGKKGADPARIVQVGDADDGRGERDDERCRREADESIGLDQEAWFLAQARQAGVPVPEVLWLGAVDTTAGSRTVMVQKAVAGRTLSVALPGMSAAQRWSAARSCGEVIARLHSVQVGGFYLRHADGSFEFADVAALQAADLANRLDNLRLLAGAGLTRAEVRRAEGLLPEAVAARGDGPAVLCHGELFTSHIFVATGEDAGVAVTGLIDFGDACGGRPLDDLEVLCWEWPDVDRGALGAGYGPAAFWNDQGRRLALGQLRMLIGYTAHDLRAGKLAQAGGYLAALKAVLASPAISARPGTSSQGTFDT
jgi:aminoglycoside phosphotransferase (APT) family kinase protein